MKVDFGLLSLADGTALTAGAGGNAVAPDYFDSLATPPGDGTVTFVSATKVAKLLTPAGGGVAQFRKAASTAQLAVEVELQGRAWPTTSSLRLLELRRDSDTAVAGRINVRTDGKIEYTDAANTWQWETTGTVPTSGSYRVYLGLKKGTTTSNGEVHIAVYLTDGKATTGAQTYDSTVRNTGITDIAAWRLGFTSGGPGGLEIRNVQWANALGQIGPVLVTPELISTRSTTRTFDYSATIMSGTRVLTAVQQSGPSVGTITVSSLVASFIDSTTRTAPVVIRFTVGNGTQSLYEDITVLPMSGHGSQRLVLRDGVWR